ncbi:carbonic anhydrase [Thalassospira mesophila]|uniref:carbonic anhydrase n=1 Tax=Thalassospira mesophila TaxID=1293891 RepID=A0A1Y2L592_9PROT|nr:carbonic anhydrase [Thalassospira mesophila]OSQ40975.1 carbonic anhydrase [Thalassospira mesophila]
MTMRTIDRMKAGFRSFKAAYYDQRPERVAHLVESGQEPEVLLIACSDSRADPAILMNAEPGDMFIVRNVANLIPPYQPDDQYHGTSAALEYGVRDLKVRDVVILGHSGCGGIQALVQGAIGGVTAPDREFIGPWMEIASCCSGHGPDVDAVSRQSVRNSLTNLLTFPFVKSGVESGYLQIHGWWFDMKEGALWRYVEENDRFEKVEG